MVLITVDTLRDQPEQRTAYLATLVMTRASVPLDEAPADVRQVIEEQYVPYERLLLRADVTDRIIEADKRRRRGPRPPRR